MELQPRLRIQFLWRCPSFQHSLNYRFCTVSQNWHYNIIQMLPAQAKVELKFYTLWGKQTRRIEFLINVDFILLKWMTRLLKMNRLHVAKTLNVNAMVRCKIHVMSKCKIIMLTCDLNYLTCQHNDAACWYDFYLAYRGQKYTNIVSMSNMTKIQCKEVISYVDMIMLHVDVDINRSHVNITMLHIDIIFLACKWQKYATIQDRFTSKCNVFLLVC